MRGISLLSFHLRAYNESAAQQNSRLINIVVFVARQMLMLVIYSLWYLDKSSGTNPVHAISI